MKTEAEMKRAIAKCKGVCRGKLMEKDCPLIDPTDDINMVLCQECTFQSTIKWVLE